jgi:TolB-like protein/DNA-binding winged helix-turn-helix (wHTH) protein
VQRSSPQDSGLPATRFRIDDLEIDTARAQVTRQGTSLPLPKLSYDLLIALAEVAPAIASTEQLLDRVWPGLVVNPETVSQRVKLLRGALGDDPRQPRYIAVVRGRGHRLIAPVSRDEPAITTAALAAPGAATTVTPAPLPPTPNAPTSMRLDWRLALATAAVVAAVLLWALWSRSEDAVRGANEPDIAVTDRSIAVLPFQNLGTAPDDNALALGVAEAVLHQLASLRDLVVISRTSSFALDRSKLDVQRIGTRLGARYLLEGSVQRADTRLRITAQLVDSHSGAHVWSLQFDRGTRDVFAVQDEIALQVAQALQVSLDPPAMARLAGQGTTRFDAYFEYLQARSLMSGGRVADFRAAREHLFRAIKLDADFAPAYVELAGALLRGAEFDGSGDRTARFESASVQAGQLIEQALALDAGAGRAYLQRADLTSFTDLQAAEADYRRGLALLPNDASGYAGLATVLDQHPKRQDETLAALDHARRLDPLEPAYDVTKAVFQFYRRDDPAGAVTILQRVVEQHPQYAPALSRLAEVKACCGDLADGIRYQELAVKLDPESEWAMRELTYTYLDIGDIEAAVDVTQSAPGEAGIRKLPVQLYRGQWQQAGETAYEALRADTALALDENTVSLALRRHARATGDRARALAALEQMADLHWNGDGEPVLGDAADMKSAVIGVADILRLNGLEDRARLLLRRTVAAIDRDAVELKRGRRWTRMARAQALAMLGDREGALAALATASTDGSLLMKHWLHLQLDPAFDPLRNLPAYRQLLAEVEVRRAAQRRKLDELRRSGLVRAR